MQLTLHKPTMAIGHLLPGLSKPILKNLGRLGFLKNLKTWKVRFLGFLGFLIFKSDFYNVQHRSAWISLRAVEIIDIITLDIACSKIYETNM